MARIFISHKNNDKPIILPIVKKIENHLGEKCWVDYKNIESDSQFADVICKAINECEVFLFMYTKRVADTTDFQHDWMSREINYAEKRRKRIVIVNVDGSNLNDHYDLLYGTKHHVDVRNKDRFAKLCDDLETWLKPKGTINTEQHHQTTDRSKIDQWSNKKNYIVPDEKDKHSENKGYSKHPFLLTTNLKRYIWILSCSVIAIIVLFLFNYLRPISNEHITPNIQDKSDQQNHEVNDSIEDIEDDHRPYVPEDFVFVPAGTLTHFLYDYDSAGNNLYKDFNLCAFYICSHEVTQKEYSEVLEDNPSTIKGDDLPVNCISFKDAVNYCNKRSVKDGYEGFYSIDGDIITIKHDGNGYRLPTEYEWVFASRAEDGTKTKYAGGNDLAKVAWYGGNSKETLHPVKTKEPNSRGLYDLNGNVSEFIWGGNIRDGYNWHIGSDISLYIGFHEDDRYGSESRSETLGMRVVLITPEIQNDNTSEWSSLKNYTSKYYKTEFYY